MSATIRPDLDDLEVDQICIGLVQNAAKIRYLQSLGLIVARRPNGRPLVARAEWEKRFVSSEQHPSSANAPRWHRQA